MSTLLDKHKDFEGVVNYFCQKLKQKMPRLDVEDFKKWMMLTEKYSPSNYKHGLFGDMRLYYYCYKVYKKMRSGMNQHHMILVSGKIGKGKSVLGSQIMALIDPTSEMSRVCYVPPHLFRRFAASNPSEANLIDEGGNFFKAKNTMTKIGKDISQAFQLVRDLQQVLIVCYDEPEKLDKDIIDKFDGIFIKVEKPNKPGDERFSSYLGFSVKACDKIKPLLKKRIPITDPQVMKEVSWHGTNTKEMPELNDFNECVYRTEKRKYLKQHMMLFAKKWQKDYDNVDKPEQVEKKPKLGVSIREYAKLKGLHESTVRKHVRNGVINHQRVGGKYVIIDEE